MNEKSVGGAFALALVFGPLGLIYASPAWGAILTGLAFITSFTIIVPIIIWIVSFVAAPYMAIEYNARVNRRWAELVGERRAVQSEPVKIVQDELTDKRRSDCRKEPTIAI